MLVFLFRNVLNKFIVNQLLQFKPGLLLGGYDGSTELPVDRDIDAISGATISVYAITHDVQQKTEILAKLVRSNHL